MAVMLERRTAREGPVYYVSPLLEARRVPHAFSTRLGGISPPPFDSLNLGNPSGCDVQDDYPRIYENFAMLQSAIGCADRPRCWVHQVHGGVVVPVRRGQAFESGPKADAMVSDDASKLLAVRVADCVPVLIASDDGKVVAAVHAGWRGVIAGVVPRAIDEMREMTDVPLVAGIGPCIGFDAFEVGPEVIEEFAATFDDRTLVRRRDDGKGHADLRRAVHLQLRKIGVPADRIDITDRCTYRDADEFFSHRRDRGVTGRMAAVIGAVE
jgi:YfiH family protein